MIVWTARNQGLYTFSSAEGALRKGSLLSPDRSEKCTYADDSRRFSRMYWMDGHLEIYPRFAKLHLQFEFPNLELKTSLELYDEEHVITLTELCARDIDTTITHYEQILERDRHYLPEDTKRTQRQLLFTRQAKRQVSNLTTHYAKQGYILIQSAQRKVTGPQEISAHETMTPRERELTRPYIHTLADTLPNLSPDFLAKEYYAELLRNF